MERKFKKEELEIVNRDSMVGFDEFVEFEEAKDGTVYPFLRRRHMLRAMREDFPDARVIVGEPQTIKDSVNKYSVKVEIFMNAVEQLEGLPSVSFYVESDPSDVDDVQPYNAVVTKAIRSALEIFGYGPSEESFKGIEEVSIKPKAKLDETKEPKVEEVAQETVENKVAKTKTTTKKSTEEPKKEKKAETKKLESKPKEEVKEEPKKVEVKTEEKVEAKPEKEVKAEPKKEVEKTKEELKKEVKEEVKEEVEAKEEKATIKFDLPEPNASGYDWEAIAQEKEELINEGLTTQTMRSRLRVINDKNIPATKEEALNVCTMANLIESEFNTVQDLLNYDFKKGLDDKDKDSLAIGSRSLGYFMWLKNGLEKGGKVAPTLLFDYQVLALIIDEVEEAYAKFETVKDEVEEFLAD